MGYYTVEIIQTIKTEKVIRAANESDALLKANKIIEKDEIPFEKYELVDAIVKAQESLGNVIKFEHYKQ